MFIFSVLSLRGFPLTMGFLSKDLILESFFQGIISCVYVFFFFLFCCFTVCYRLKLAIILIYIMKSGFVVFRFELFEGSRVFLLCLFFILLGFGLILEEVLIEDDIFSFSQDYKCVDLFIFGVGLFFLKKDFFYLKFFMFLDFIWVSTFYRIFSDFFVFLRGFIMWVFSF